MTTKLGENFACVRCGLGGTVGPLVPRPEGKLSCPDKDACQRRRLGISPREEDVEYFRRKDQDDD